MLQQEENVACCMKQGFSVFMQRLRVLKGKFLVNVRCARQENLL